MESQLFLSLVTLSALTALLELDDVCAGQFLFARPLMVGVLLGLAYGDIKTGAQLGIWTELLLLDQLPVGGYVPPSGGVCAAGAFMMAYLCMLPLSLSFALGLVMGKGYALMESRLRAWRSTWNVILEEQVRDNPAVLNRWMLKSLAVQLAAGFVFIFLSAQFLSLAGGRIWDAMPEELQNAVDLAYFAVPWIGLASLTFTLYSKPKAAAHA